MSAWRRRELWPALTLGRAEGFRIVALPLLALAVLCALVLALPGQTVVTRYLADLLIALDGAHRIVAGQVPHRDFHSPWGPLAYYIPAAGYLLSGRLGAAMPTGMALVTILLAPFIAYVAASRLRPMIALPFGAFLIFVVVTPINLGESATALSFAKFYNNLGWASLASLLVMYLPPRPAGPGRDASDLVSAAVLTLVMAYTKLTYGLAALAFLLFLLLDSRQRRWAGGALALSVITCLVVEAFWRGSITYLADLRMAAAVSGLVRGTAGEIVDHVLGNLSDYVLLCVFAGVSLWRTRSLLDLVFYVACAVGGFLIVNQNFQAWGILTLHAAAAVAAEKFLRVSDVDPETGDRLGPSLRSGIQLLFVALVLPTIVHSALALGLHATAAATRSGREIMLPGLAGVRLANLWTWGDYEGWGRYVDALEDGAAALAGEGAKPARVFVLGLANPFSAGLDLEPARGDSSWLLWGRNVGAADYPPPERLFAGVQIVLEPKPPADARETDSRDEARKSLVALYQPYLAAEFEPVRETEHWTIHRRKPAP